MWAAAQATKINVLDEPLMLGNQLIAKINHCILTNGFVSKTAFFYSSTLHQPESSDLTSRWESKSQSIALQTMHSETRF